MLGLHKTNTVLSVFKNFTIGTFLLLFFLIETGCGSLFFYPQKKFLDNNPASRHAPEDIYFKTADGITLHGWFLRARPKAEATILVLHGNAENLSTHVNGVLWLIDEGFNIFIFDYRGYGKSGGKPSLPGVHLDAEAALETMLALPEVDKDKVFVLGQSIGGAIATYTVAHSPYKRHIKALIIDSAFASYRQIAREKMDMVWLTWPFQYPLSWAFSDRYSPVKFIAGVAPVPVLIIHGMNDAVVPVHHGQQLFDAAGEPKELWLTGSEGHIRSMSDPEVRRRLKAYLLSKLQ